MTRTIKNAKKTGEQGFLTFPMAMLLAVMGCAGLGLIGLLKEWDRRACLQLELDRCARSLALALRNTQRRIESLNSKITLARAAAATALAAGNAAAAEASRKVIDALVLLQEAELLSWKRRQAVQMASLHCPLDPAFAADFAKPIPWYRPPADPLGASRLLWQPEAARSRGLRIQLAMKGLKTHAFVRLSIQGDQGDQGQWIASYRPPELGAGPH